MRGGRGPKNKGSSWERDVCRRLSLWVTRGADEGVFWRSAMSGGRATVHRRRGSKAADGACGDICAIKKEGHAFLNLFFVECKATKNLALEAYLLPSFKGNREDHWVKPCAQAKEHGKAPLVIIKRNNLPPLVMVNPGGRDILQRLTPDRMTALAYFPKYGVTIFALDYLLDECDPRRLR